MTVRVTVLYEDQAGEGALRSFGPHELLLALVADQTTTPVHELRAEVDAHPANGAAKLLAKCADEVGENIASDCHPVIALFDKDRIRKTTEKRYLPTGFPPGATDAQIVQMLEGLCPKAGKLHVVLLDRNVETLLEAVRDEWPGDSAAHEEQYADAIQHKSRNDRDLVLGRLANTRGAAGIRLQVMRRVCGLGGWRDAVIDALRRPRPSGDKS